MTSKAAIAIEQSSVLALEKERFYQRVLTKWLKGYSIGDIVYSEGGVTSTSVIQAINIKRKELVESQGADIEQLAAERIAGLKVIQKEAFDYIELYPEKVASLLTVALRSEETQAKIQGVLNEKVMHLGRIEHTVKLYDFEDKTPGSTIIEMVRTNPDPELSLQEPELERIETVVEIDEARLDVIKPKVKEAIMPITKKKRIAAATVINSIVMIRSGDEILE